MRRILGILLLIATLLAVLGHVLSTPGNTIQLPSVGWLFHVASPVQPWLGWILTLLLLALSFWLLKYRDFAFTPMTARKLKRFKEIGRGWWSFRILIVLVAIACLDQVVVGRRALAVKYDDHWHFPAFRKEIYKASFFGQPGDGEADYRLLAKTWATSDSNNRAILPIIPWGATSDTDASVQKPLEEANGILMDRSGKPFSGMAFQFHTDSPTQRARQARFRNGTLHLNDEIYDLSGNVVKSVTWDYGKKIAEKSPATPAQSPATVADPDSNTNPASDSFSTGPWVEVDYPPISPTFSSRHFLGTDSRGWDVAAQLFGGFQVIIQASILYLIATYAIGITLGLLMGFRGGWYDMLLQRLIEIFSSIPFLYLVIILVSIWDRDRIGMTFIVGVLCLFSWIGCAQYIRSATYKEKSRDYVAAARVMGASPRRIIFKHILPNTLSVLVTLIPFSITGISSSLTALDFIGFGLPESYPSWGRLLSDGVEYLRTAPWIVSGVFVMLVCVLLLVTFVGEALREAFDPKKFTTYR